MTKDKLCSGLAFRVVNTEQMYNLSDDTMIVDGYDGIRDAFHGYIGFDLLIYYYNILIFYRNVMY